jgi:hypothetical protein
MMNNSTLECLRIGLELSMDALVKSCNDKISIGIISWTC